MNDFVDPFKDYFKIVRRKIVFQSTYILYFKFLHLYSLFHSELEEILEQGCAYKSDSLLFVTTDEFVTPTILVCELFQSKYQKQFGRVSREQGRINATLRSGHESIRFGLTLFR